MFRGMYTAASGMIASERNQQVLNNNLANAETPGYKSDQAVIRSFPELLIQQMGGGQGHVKGKPSFSTGGNPIGALNTGVYTQEGIFSMQQGAIQATGRVFDLAIVDQSLPVNPESGQRGHLVFGVQVGEDEIRYTRSGDFVQNDEGFIVTKAGHLVLDENLDPIQVDETNVRITEDGRILSGAEDGQDGEELGRLWIGYTESPERFSKEGNGLLQWVSDDQEAPGLVYDVDFLFDVAGNVPYQIRQGFIERSNVDVSRTMTDMLNMYRAYEANQKVIQAYDRSMELSANQIGSLR